jgi:hypothetical protein
MRWLYALSHYRPTAADHRLELATPYRPFRVPTVNSSVPSKSRHLKWSLESLPSGHWQILSRSL